MSTTYTFTNVAEQGLNVTWILGAETKHTLLGSGLVTTFEADSLTPETQSLIDAGWLVQGGVGAAVTVTAVAAVPLILVGPYQSTVQYKKGHVVLSASIYYVGLRTSTGATPGSAPLDWEVFGGPSTGSLGSHIADVGNPHSVTASQVAAIATALKGAANGVAELDASTLVPVAQLTYAIATVQTVADIAARTALTPKQGDFAKVTDADGAGTTKSYMYSGSVWIEVVAAAPVASVNGETGVVVLTTTDVAEGTSLYYTAGRVTAHTDVAANTAARHSQGSDVALDTGNPNEVTSAQLRTHLNSVANPHVVTAAQVGAITQLADDLSPVLGAALAAGGFVISGLADTLGATNAATQGFVAGLYLPLLANFTNKAGSYEIAAGDSASVIRFTATATATLPAGLDSGFQVVIANAGSGTITIATPGTLNSKGTQITTQYSSATFTHIGGDVWEGYGDLV